MDPDYTDILIADLDGAQAWPLPRERDAREQVARGRALRRPDRAWLRALQAWPGDRDYIADALPRRIADGWAEFFFAEDVTITAAGDNTAAQDELDHQIEVNRLHAGFYRAARRVVSEGEQYWKIHVNRAIADCPLLTWNSRLDVVPMFDGDRLVAAGFVTERCRRHEKYHADDDEAREVIYRHFEIHGPGRVQNVLYRGTDDELGRRVELTAIPQTAGYNPDWQHDLPMLAGRVTNALDDDDTLGVSEYDAVLDELLALNEALTIAAENARLTGKDRIITVGRFRRADGTFDVSLDVFEVEQDGGTLGEGDKRPPVAVIEKSYDAEPLWTHITNLVKTILRGVGLVPQWIGEDVQGSEESGRAIRLRFLPTTKAAKGKTREWLSVIPHQLDLLLQVTALAVDAGGFGRTVEAAEPPAVEFADPLPRDESEQITDVSTAVLAGVMSRRTGVRTLHPEWDDEQVNAELEEIREDLDLTTTAPPPPPA